MRNKLIAALACLIVFITSCKKDEVKDKPEVDSRTPVGTVTGALVKKHIGISGGELVSDDGVLRVQVPAGAVPAETEFSVQEISSEFPSGIRTYRLLPHGVNFNLPVTISFNYSDEDTVGHMLDIAYQHNDGSWKMMVNTERDKVNKQLRVSTRHFSDWTYFKSLSLTPAEATVEPGGSVDLKLTTYLPYIDPNDLDEDALIISLIPATRELRADEVKGWKYFGDGILISQAAKAFYTAPEEVPSTNPEAVSAEIEMPVIGRFLLVSNITVLSDHKVDYLQVDEDIFKPGNNGQPMLYLYGNFGFDPGADKRSVTINSEEVDVDIWTPSFIRCRINREIHGAIKINANNKTIASTVLRRFEGKLVYERFHGGVLNSSQGNALKEKTVLTLVYRGFGKPCPPDLEPFPISGALALGTKADYGLGGSASVTTPGDCPKTSSVNIPATTGSKNIDYVFSASPQFKCDVVDLDGGIELQFDFRILNVVTGIVVNRSNCFLSFPDPPHGFGVSLDGFNFKKVELVFSGTSGLKLPGNGGLQSNLMASGILNEAWDGNGNPSHYETDGLMPATLKNF